MGLRHLTGAKALEKAGPGPDNVALFPFLLGDCVFAVANAATDRGVKIFELCDLLLAPG